MSLAFRSGLRRLVAIALGLCVSASWASITIPTVIVGYAGNAPDSTGYGAVAYPYRIGTYEVTAGQYTAFLNAVAVTDSNGLYNPFMSDTEFGSGITRSGSNGSYSYAVAATHVNRPVNYVSFWSATRFANWLHNGQPSGLQSSSTTEDGAYTLTPAGISANTIARNAGWQWAIASEDEWYKAAYYKSGGTSAGYWAFATSSNTPPGRDMTDPLGNNANYFTGIGAYPIDSPHYTTIVGEFQNSPSPYGTSDQTGNVWEWNEAIINTAQRGLRGGSFETLAAFVQASHRTQNFPMNEGYDVGFRVVTLIPEPGLLTPLALTGVAMLRRRSATSHAAPGSPAPCASPVMTSLRHGFREVSA